MYKEISLKGNKALFVMDDGMCNNMQVIWQVIGPVLFAPNMPNEPSRQADYIRDRITTGADQSQTYDLDEAITDVLSGLIVLFIDGVDFALNSACRAFRKEALMMQRPRCRREARMRGLRRASRIMRHFYAAEFVRR